MRYPNRTQFSFFDQSNATSGFFAHTIKKVLAHAKVFETRIQQIVNSFSLARILFEIDTFSYLRDFFNLLIWSNLCVIEIFKI